MNAPVIIYASQHARELLDAANEAACVSATRSTFNMFERRGLSITTRSVDDERPQTDVERAEGVAACREVVRATERVLRYVASLENGARCAYDTLVAEAVAARDLSAQLPGEAERSYFRRNARDLAARAREIAQAFKPEQAAA